MKEWGLQPQVNEMFYNDKSHLCVSAVKVLFIDYKYFDWIKLFPHDLGKELPVINHEMSEVRGEVS